MRIHLLALLFVFTFSPLVAGEQSSVIPDQEAGPPREPYWQLFLDDHSIARSTGFRRIVRYPRPRGIVLKADQA